MKFFAVLFIATLAAAVGYLMGTEDGRRRRDDLVTRIRKEADKVADKTAETVADVASDVAEAAEEAA